MSSYFHFSLVIRDTGDSRHVITKGHVINRNPDTIDTVLQIIFLVQDEFS